MSSNQSSSRGRKRASTSTLNTRTTTNTTATRNSRPYDRDFQQNLVDGGVYPEEYEYPDGRVPPSPDNCDEINQRLVQPRPSLSPSQFSDGAFKKFKRANTHAFKEREVTKSVIPIIEGEISDNKCVAGGVPLTNFDHLTNGTLAPGNPDLFYGARPEQLGRQIRNELSGRIITSTQDDLPIAPNFFLAAKGPDGTAVVARRQACYDGALGARGIHSLQTYGQHEPTYNNHAYTLTSIYSDGQLKMYTSRPTQPANNGDRPEYYMNQINSWGMTGNVETFRQGATAYRNGRDWAKEKRDGFIEAANTRILRPPQDISLESSDYSQPSTCTSKATAPESETSTDEVALDNGVTNQLPSKRLKRGGRERKCREDRSGK